MHISIVLLQVQHKQRCRSHTVYVIVTINHNALVAFNCRNNAFDGNRHIRQQPHITLVGRTALHKRHCLSFGTDAAVEEQLLQNRLSLPALQCSARHITNQWAHMPRLAQHALRNRVSFHTAIPTAHNFLQSVIATAELYLSQMLESLHAHRLHGNATVCRARAARAGRWMASCRRCHATRSPGRARAPASRVRRQASGAAARPSDDFSGAPPRGCGAGATGGLGAGLDCGGCIWTTAAPCRSTTSAARLPEHPCVIASAPPWGVPGSSRNSGR